ncbi:NADH-quinone oxidoreductase subunit NuoH [Candidatus Methanodesulfokora washburnensis]|jgi:NADH-quinone oxidoreductase subunit H|uniref:NADH-quinone oxidoreductase subunit NuoH n=1 Tax=Candidatus Methanodesulfokora washburnensis TaxID=2478471 RepID=A0A429GMJ6_9CREN|nr:NADH-quinone oxidoreductase subunit NuoH [Candidatus Methanodesulfokores washburnensis]RSN75082.1 NADH-quinone oxidoreductase subunit NuoH [Candidatus Methanodesulfokores washburnensis]
MQVQEILNILFEPYIFIPLVFPGLIAAFIVLLIIIWLERKIAAKVQLRYGPLYIIKPLGGVIQTVADLIRYLFQEPIIPKDVDKLAFLLTPVFLFGLAYLPVVVIPIGPSYYAFRSDLSLLIALALTTLAPIFTVLMGWASNNKFSLIGSVREGYLVISYEIPIFLSALSMAILYGTLDLVEIAEAQRGIWGIFLNPVAAVNMLVLMYMSTSKFPFEIPEAESEIVAGPYTEYGGILYGLVMGASYVKLYVLSLVYSILFLGGWNPLPQSMIGNPFISGSVLFIKSFILVAFGAFLRAVYPRFRIDQAIGLGWRISLPLSLISIFISLLLVMGGVRFVY